MNLPDVFKFKHIHDSETIYTATAVEKGWWNISWIENEDGICKSRWRKVDIERWLNEGTWKMLPDQNAAVMGAAIGTVLEITVEANRHRGDEGKYKFKKVGPDIWECRHIYLSDEYQGVAWKTAGIRGFVARGSWTVERVVAPVAPTEPVVAKPLDIRTMVALYDLDVAFRVNGCVWFSNGPLSICVNPDEDWEEGLARVEKAFATVKIS